MGTTGVQQPFFVIVKFLKFWNMKETLEALKFQHKLQCPFNPFTPKSDQLQFSLSDSHQRYIIQYGEFDNRQLAQIKVD